MLKNSPHIGSPRERVDGVAKVTGQATYAAEFFAPDLAHGYIIEATIAKGRIISIDVESARAISVEPLVQGGIPFLLFYPFVDCVWSGRQGPPIL